MLDEVPITPPDLPQRMFISEHFLYIRSVDFHKH